MSTLPLHSSTHLTTHDQLLVPSSHLADLKKWTHRNLTKFTYFLGGRSWPWGSVATTHHCPPPLPSFHLGEVPRDFIRDPQCNPAITVVVVLPEPFRGMEEWRNSTETQQLGRAAPDVKNGSSAPTSRRLNVVVRSSLLLREVGRNGEARPSGRLQSSATTIVPKAFSVLLCK